MKQIPLLQGKALLIELPEKHEAAFKALRNGRELTINRKNKSANVDHIMFDFEFAEQLFNHGLLECTSGNLDTKDRHYLFGLGWRIIGMLSEVTEKEVALVVPIHRQSIIGDVYKDFKTGKWDAFDALESLESGILAEGYSFSNIEINPDDFKAGTFSSGEHQRLRDRFESARSRVLCRERCLLLGRVDL